MVNEIDQNYRHFPKFDGNFFIHFHYRITICFPWSVSKCRRCFNRNYWTIITTKGKAHSAMVMYVPWLLLVMGYVGLSARFIRMEMVDYRFLLISIEPPTSILMKVEIRHYWWKLFANKRALWADEKTFQSRVCRLSGKFSWRNFNDAVRIWRISS